jgi:Methyltransferase TRM13
MILAYRTFSRRQNSSHNDAKGQTSQLSFNNGAKLTRHSCGEDTLLYPTAIPTMASRVSNVTGEEVQILILKLERAKGSILADLPLVDLFDVHGVDRGGKTPPKHLRQTESIAGHLKHLGIIPSKGACFIELGCGTAKLSNHLSEILDGGCSHILIDKVHASDFKAERLRDGAIRNRQQPNHYFVRVAADLQDRGLIDDVIRGAKKHQSEANANFIAVSKHLCGSAADFAIHGIDYYCSSAGNHLSPPPPLAVAACCHHRCDNASFSNMDFFTHLGFSRRDFEVLRTVSQWSSIKIQRVAIDEQATSASEGGSERYASLPALRPEPLPMILGDAPLVPSEKFEREFTREEKAALGKRCKLTMDTARGNALKRIGYQSIRFVRYTTLSLEDTLIIAM